MHHVRERKHGARSTQPAIAIGRSKARRAGFKLTAPRKGKASSKTRKKGGRDYREGQGHSGRKPSARRSRATRAALKKEGRAAASHKSLAKHAHTAAQRRGSVARHRSAMKEVRTKASKGRSQAAAHSSLPIAQDVGSPLRTRRRLRPPAVQAGSHSKNGRDASRAATYRNGYSTVGGVFADIEIRFAVMVTPTAWNRTYMFGFLAEAFARGRDHL
jgi:hypothetical protein